MQPECTVCGKELLEPSEEFFERDKVCDECWSEWKKERQQLEREYWNTRL